MNKMLTELIKEFKKNKKIRGDLFNNFVAFCDMSLMGLKDDKYKEMKIDILKYIVANKKTIKLQLIRN